MANVTGFITTSVVDYLGDPAAFQTFFTTPDTSTLAQVITDAIALQDKQDKVMDGQIVGMEVKITVPLDITAIKTSPVNTAEVERTGLVNFKQQNIKYKYGYDIPTLARTIWDLGSAWLTDANVKALIDLIIAGGTVLGYDSKFLNDITGVLDGVLTFRKHRKSLIRSSFEEAPAGE